MSKKERKLSPITDLFDKYKRTLKAPQGVVIEAFVEVVADITGFTLNHDQVRYTVVTKTISIRASGALKTEIKLNQEEILRHLRGRLGLSSTPKLIL